MPKRKIILLVIAALVALGTVVIARSLMSPTTPDGVVQAPVIETTEILAAAHDLPTGTILKEMDLKWITWASTADTAPFYVKGKAEKSSLVGAVLREGLHGDEPLLMGRVVQPHDHGFLAALLSPGMRAVSVVLSPSSEVAGFILPGDHVDVILTHSFSRKDVTSLTERRVSESVITDTRVLALDQKTDNQATDPKVAQIVTLEVTPAQAEKLALAIDLVGAVNSGKGTLSLALRSLAVETVEGATPLVPARSAPTWDSDVSSAYPGVGGDDRLMERVQIMRGKEKTETTFERHTQGNKP